MYNLSRNDLEEVLKLVNFCMTHIKMGECIEPTDLLTEMRNMFHSYDASFFPPNESLTGVDLQNTFSLKQASEDLQKYIDHYWQYDPLYSAQFTPEPVNLVFKTDDVISYAQLKKLNYYREYLQRINWFGELVIRLCTNDSFWGSMSISRSPKQTQFGPTDVRKAEILLPYLINTFEATMLFSKIKQERSVFERWLESRPEGIVLLDARMKPIFHNSKARELCKPLSGRYGDSTTSNADIAVPRIVIDDCRQLVESNARTSCLSRNRIINTRNGEKYFLKYSIIDQQLDDIELPYLIVHISDLSRSSEDTAVILDKVYELTKREEKIAWCIAKGLTNREIGEKLGISQFTVQSHLRNIFEKTGIKRRSQLTSLIQ